ncbi:MAG: putative DNA modification/repair radical SAM protein [Clostridiales bacterium]|jgi:putative DNA modification/repair radical SAM protein|nr:putative DNA modification/repair radical SAM protein [Clostridiales bacterium]
MDLMEKLKILSAAAKYDVACTSSGVNRGGARGSLGSASACGICHTFAADGRCVSLLKILMTNVCVYDCQYCANRRSNDLPRASFTPREIAELTINFYKRNYIEGLFLSSAVIRDASYTMEQIYETLKLVRHVYRFNGYIHIKAIPGADECLIRAAGLLADRVSVNIELPSEESLNRLAPDKTRESILKPMNMLKNNIIQSREEVMLFHSAPRFAPAGQSTQMIVGATPESDKKIITLTENLYKRYSLKRVFYSAYTPVSDNPLLPAAKPPLLREHRLYQADWLLRFYGFSADEILKNADDNLNPNLDPKCCWALNNLNMFPVEINTANKRTLLRVPGIGSRSADRILAARRVGLLTFENLKKLGVVLKRARYFITCRGKMYEKISMDPAILEMKLTESKIREAYKQLSLFDEPAPLADSGNAAAPGGIIYAYGHI